jgi:hypothetical protein
VVLDADAAAAGATPERGWHPDATWRLIQVLAALRLIDKVKTPKTRVCFAAKQLVPTPSLLRTHHDWHIPEPEEAPELVAS